MSDNLWEKVNESIDLYLEENQKLSPLLEEINLIKDETIRNFTRAMLLSVDMFWEAPASPTGRYHPPDERGEGGEVLHTKRVVRITKILAESQERTSYETDVLISAALLHDIKKVVEGADGSIYSDPMHPITVDLQFKKLRERELKSTEELGSTTKDLDYDTINEILRCVRCHLGQWSPIPELIPVTPFESTVHWADNIASKLHTVVDFL